MGDDWQTLEFGDLLIGGTRNGIYKKKEFHGSGVKIVNMGELFAYPRLYDIPMKRVELTEKELHKSSLDCGDLLFARRSLVAEGAGKCSIVMEVNEPTTFESSIIRARPNPAKANSLFLYYVFSSPQGRYLLSTIVRQVAVAGITGSDLVRLCVPLPHLETQGAIAHILGALDDKIELNRRMNQTLEAMAQAIFKSWFVDFDPVRAKAAGEQPPGLAPHIADLFPDAFEESELGEIPKGWGIEPIGDIVEAVGGGTPSTKNPAYWEEGEHYFATPKSLSGLSSPILLEAERKVTDAGLDKISSGLLPVGTVLLSSRAPVGYLAIAQVPVCVNQGFIAMICNGPVSNYYVLNWAYANMPEIKRRAGGTTFAEISKRNFRPIPALVPSPEVVKAFDTITEPLYTKIALNLEESSTLAALRDTLLPKLISGELRIPDAERILERCLQ